MGLSLPTGMRADGGCASATPLSSGEITLPPPALLPLGANWMQTQLQPSRRAWAWGRERSDGTRYRAARPLRLTGRLSSERQSVAPLSIACLGACVPSSACPPTRPRSSDRGDPSPPHHPTGRPRPRARGKEDTSLPASASAHASRASLPHGLSCSLGEVLCGNGC